jgi:hypothetical protein
MYLRLGFYVNNPCILGTLVVLMHKLFFCTNCSYVHLGSTSFVARYITSSCHIQCCRWWTTKVPMRFGRMGRTRVRALHATTTDVQREMAEQHDSSNIWSCVDPM